MVAVAAECASAVDPPPFHSEVASMAEACYSAEQLVLRAGPETAVAAAGSGDSWLRGAAADARI